MKLKSRSLYDNTGMNILHSARCSLKPGKRLTLATRHWKGFVEHHDPGGDMSLMSGRGGCPRHHASRLTPFPFLSTSMTADGKRKRSSSPLTERQVALRLLRDLENRMTSLQDVDDDEIDRQLLRLSRKLERPLRTELCHFDA